MTAGAELPRRHWHDRAKCSGTNPNRWYRATVTNWHRQHCADCPVLLDCAADALIHHDNGVIRAATALTAEPRSRRPLRTLLANAGATRRT